MAAITSPALRKLLAFGTAAGVVAGENDLEVSVVRVRPSGVSLLGTLRIAGYRERPAAEWGAEYSRFLASHNAASAAALVVLPRNELITRTITLPGVSDTDSASAISFQLESLHPFGADEIVHDWQRVGRSAAFLIVIARRETIDSWTTLFVEAGIRLAGFTFAASPVYRALRTWSEPQQPAGFLAAAGLEASAPQPFLYGESPATPIFHTQAALPMERAATLAAAELRLEPGSAPQELARLLPPWSTTASDIDLSDAARSRVALPYAAALAAAVPHLGAPLNLLPPGLRARTSRLAYVPTAALAVILTGLGIALLLQNSWLDRRYLAQLDAETKRLEPVVRRMEATGKETDELLRRLQVLNNYRRSSRRDLDALLDLTRMIPAPGYVQNLALERGSANIVGEAVQADEFLKKLEASPLFRAAEFASPLGRSPDGKTEFFRIRAVREEVR